MSTPWPKWPPKAPGRGQRASRRASAEAVMLASQQWMVIFAATPASARPASPAASTARPSPPPARRRQGRRGRRHYHRRPRPAAPAGAIADRPWGGSNADLERARPLLVMANIFHASSVGAGQTAKICNNMLLGILMAQDQRSHRLGGQRPRPQGAERTAAPPGGNWRSTTPSPRAPRTPPPRATRRLRHRPDAQGLRPATGKRHGRRPPRRWRLARAIMAHSTPGIWGEDFSSDQDVKKAKQCTQARFTFRHGRRSMNARSCHISPCFIASLYVCRLRPASVAVEVHVVL